jgi:DNA-directed RNA polymerase specialized sigma24 family protein
MESLAAELLILQCEPALDDLSEKEEHRVARVEAVRKVLGSLPDIDRDIAISRWVDDEKPGAIAARLGLRSNTVWTRLSALKRHLRHELSLALAGAETRDRDKTEVSRPHTSNDVKRGGFWVVSVPTERL